MADPAPPIPRRLDLKKDRSLRIEWADGLQSDFPVNWLRQMCPCAACRALRTGTDPHSLLQPDTGGAGEKVLSLNVLPRHFTSAADAIQVTSAELVGNYALQVTFSDGHTSGIYSFAYLRELAES
jgi:DUF971 family protein